MKAAVTSETQLASSDLATVAECIAYLRDRVPWPVDEIFNFQQEKGEKGEGSLSLLVQPLGPSSLAKLVFNKHGKYWVFGGRIELSGDTLRTQKKTT